MTEDIVARTAARLALQPLLMQPANVRIAAVTMMLQLVMMTDVKASTRMQFYEDLVDRLRNDLVDDLNRREPPDDGKKRNHRRGNRSAGARKKAKR